MNDPQRFQRLKELYQAAVALGPADRRGYLREKCGDDDELRREVERLLALEDGDDADVLRTGVAASVLDDEFPALPENIGPYRVLGLLGEGGMGIVVRALQSEPLRREVAVKVMRSSLASSGVIARFELERRTLARMQHPHIAQIFDAGSDDEGRPYFVMELVDGVPLTEYCTHHLPDIGGRVRLLSQVCRTIQYAHQKGIIHRDLKPSNVLVSHEDGSPVPKVIDFGIAKAIESSEETDPGRTRDGQLIGTLMYMSPEQAAGGSQTVDVRTDVYALGVMAYSAFAGRHPYGKDLSLQQMIQEICFTAPPSIWSRRPADANADLEVVVAKALAKSPDERYGSVGAFADDLDRTLRNEPVMARAPTAIYQLRKLVSRHRASSVLVASIVVLVLGFAVAMSVLYARADAHLNRALAAEKQSTQVSSFLIDSFQVSNPSESRGRELTAREILERGSERIGRELSDQPEVRVTMLHTIGGVYLELGMLEESRRLLNEAAGLRSELTLPEDEDSKSVLSRARIDADLGRLAEAEGEPELAVSHYRSALEALESVLSSEDPEVGSALVNLASGQHALGAVDESKASLERAASLLRGGERFRLDHARALSLLARLHLDEFQLDRAESLYVESLAIRDELQPDHPDLAVGLMDLASLYRRQDRRAEAVKLAERAVAITERTHGSEHPDFVQQLTNVGMLYMELDDFEQAEPLLTRALDVKERVLGPEHPSVSASLSGLGVLYRKQGNMAEAETCLQRSLEIRETVMGVDHPRVSNVLYDLGLLYTDWKKFARAQAALERAIDLRETAYGHDDVRTALPVHQLGILYTDQERYRDAEPHLRRALEIRRAGFEPGHLRVRQSLEAVAAVTRALGKTSQADSLEAELAKIEGS